ncbi:hypothetical protein IFM89_025306 [Coptis chinensis]|uniref:Uncharacterized protein n=1 Tax=Coptis chinensis TaxID=261450 RepID=A0A835LSU6_9MAGN|nr:hypothetical protein IFM89_025306 [Coptis chinensis]
MGVSASKRVSKSLQDSPQFTTTCNSVYKNCLNLTQHAFPGIRPYQLLHASTLLHQSLSSTHPLIKKWVPSPPNQNQVDTALSTITKNSPDQNIETLNQTIFKEFAVEVFKDVIVYNAGKAVVERVPFGIVGIAGIGILTKSGKEVVGSVMGVYALGVATAIYLSLSA